MKHPAGGARKIQLYIWSVFRFVLVVGLCYIILYPFLLKILVAFMDPSDLTDATVNLIPKHWSLYYWKYSLSKLDLKNAGVLTFRLSLVSAVIQVLVCTLVGYGFARFRFRGRGLLFAMVIVVMLIPSQVYSIAQYLGFRYFGVGGLTVNLIDTELPIYILAFGGMSIKQGLYIYLMREFFKGLPNDLENAAAVDGASVMRTFVSVMLPNARTMMITVFLFAFCWQWTDISFSSLYFSEKITLAEIPTVDSIMRIRTLVASSDGLGTGIAQNAAAILVILPLVGLAILCQKYLVQSISQSGLAN